LQEDNSTPEKINLSVDEERRRLQKEQQRLRGEIRQKEAELKETEGESIATLNDAFDVLQRSSPMLLKQTISSKIPAVE
jgi:hypothetical protein